MSGPARRRRPAKWADEERAETLGIDTNRIKIAVFAPGAVFLGLLSEILYMLGLGVI